MAPNTVHVSNISAGTDEKQIRDFFSFCGKITDLQVSQGEDKTQKATVVFEKDAAARTAQLLNQTQLNGTNITVNPEDANTEDHEHANNNVDSDSPDIAQEQKPRSRILAEYLAHGYVVTDAALQRGIELDQKHGVSSRFMNTLTSLDSKYNASDRAKAADQSYGVTQRASSIFSGLSSYFEKATNTPTGQKLVKFYTDGQRQVMDIHEEASRLAKLKTEAAGSAAKASGLERVLGKSEKAPEEEKTGESSSGVPAPGPKAGTMESTPIAPTGEIPSKEPDSEKS